MKLSTDRILTTHAGSLARPAGLLDQMKLKLSGEPYDHDAYDRTVREAIADVIQKQAASGIDVMADGEMSKPGFFAYVQDRLDGFEPRPNERHNLFEAELKAFPEYYEEYFARAMLGGAVAPMIPMLSTPYSSV